MGRVKSYYRKDQAYLFVDGYNIINSWSCFKDMLTEDFEGARLRLMDLLADYAHYSGQFVVLVYDGYRVKKNPGEEFFYKGIRVVFTKAFQTADHYIEQELNAIGRHRTVRVATSDSMEQQMILSRGGTRISARELELEVLNAKKGLVRRSKDLKDQARLDHLEEETLESLLDLRKRLDPKWRDFLKA